MFRYMGICNVDGQRIEVRYNRDRTWGARGIQALDVFARSYSTSALPQYPIPNPGDGGYFPHDLHRSLLK